MPLFLHFCQFLTVPVTVPCPVCSQDCLGGSGPGFTAESCHCSSANQLVMHYYLPFPSWRLPHPEIMHFLPTGNFCTASGRQTGWMYLLKTRGLASSSIATSKSRIKGSKRGCWITLVTLTFTAFPSVPFSDVVPTWASISSGFVLQIHNPKHACSHTYA